MRQLTVPSVDADYLSDCLEGDRFSGNTKVGALIVFFLGFADCSSSELACNFESYYERHGERNGVTPSRKTVHKWARRYRLEGLKAFHHVSGRPRKMPDLDRKGT
jgi:hypothetical protein